MVHRLVREHVSELQTQLLLLELELLVLFDLRNSRRRRERHFVLLKRAYRRDTVLCATHVAAGVDDVALRGRLHTGGSRVSRQPYHAHPRTATAGPAAGVTPGTGRATRARGWGAGTRTWASRMKLLTSAPSAASPRKTLACPQGARQHAGVAQPSGGSRARALAEASQAAARRRRLPPQRLRSPPLHPLAQQPPAPCCACASARRARPAYHGESLVGSNRRAGCRKSPVAHVGKSPVDRPLSKSKHLHTGARRWIRRRSTLQNENVEEQFGHAKPDQIGMHSTFVTPCCWRWSGHVAA